MSSIEARISLNNQDFKNGMKDAQNVANGTMRNISKGAKNAGGAMDKLNEATSSIIKSTGGMQGFTSVLAKMGPYGTAAAAAITAISAGATAVYKGIGRLTGRLDGIAKEAKSLNMSANGLIALQHASSRAGIEMSAMVNVVTRLDEAILKAASGEERFQKILYKIGLSWRELEKMTPEKRIVALHKALVDFKGEELPKELYELLGRKGVLTANKMRKETQFGKFMAESSALGFNLNPNLVKLAESYQDSSADLEQKLLAVVTRFENIEKITSYLEKIKKKIADNISGSGKVDDAFKDSYEGIGDVVMKTLNNFGFSTQFMRDFLYQDSISSIMKYGEGGLGEVMMMKRNKDEINKLSPRQIRSMFRKKLLDADFNKMDDNLKSMLFQEAASKDERFKNFDFNDKSTWVQEKLSNVSSNVNLAEEAATDAVDRFVKSVQEQKQSLEEVEKAKDKSIDSSKAILDIEKQLSEELGKKITLTNAQREAITKEVEELNKQIEANKKLKEQEKQREIRNNFNKNLNESVNDAKYDLMDKMGQGREASIEQALANVSAKLGITISEMTQEQRDVISRLAELKYDVSKWETPTYKDDVVKTNDLARRGGFNSSVFVVDKSLENEKAQLNALKQLQSLMEQQNQINSRIAGGLF